MRWGALAVIITGCRALIVSSPPGSCWPVAAAPGPRAAQRPRSVPACLAPHAAMRLQRSETQVQDGQNQEHPELTLTLLTTDIEQVLVLHAADRGEWDLAFSAKLLARPDGMPSLDCAIPEQPYSRALARALLASHRGLPLLPPLDGLLEIDESAILETWSHPILLPYPRHHARCDPLYRCRCLIGVRATIKSRQKSISTAIRRWLAVCHAGAARAETPNAQGRSPSRERLADLVSRPRSCIAAACVELRRGILVRNAELARRALLSLALLPPPRTARAPLLFFTWLGWARLAWWR